MTLCAWCPKSPSFGDLEYKPVSCPSVVKDPLDLSAFNLEHSYVRSLPRRPAPILLLRQESLIHTRHHHMRIARENPNRVRSVLRFPEISAHARSDLLLAFNPRHCRWVLIHECICTERQRLLDFTHTRFLLHRLGARLQILPDQLLRCAVLRVPCNRETGHQQHNFNQSSHDR